MDELPGIKPGMGYRGSRRGERAVIELLPGVGALSEPDLIAGSPLHGLPADGNAAKAGGCGQDRGRRRTGNAGGARDNRIHSSFRKG